MKNKDVSGQYDRPKGDQIAGGGSGPPMTDNQTAASKDNYSKSNPTGAKLNPKAINRQGGVPKGAPCGPTGPNKRGPI